MLTRYFRAIRGAVSLKQLERRKSMRFRRNFRAIRGAVSLKPPVGPVAPCGPVAFPRHSWRGLIEATSSQPPTSGYCLTPADDQQKLSRQHFRAAEELMSLTAPRFVGRIQFTSGLRTYSSNPMIDTRYTWLSYTSKASRFRRSNVVWLPATIVSMVEVAFA